MELPPLAKNNQYASPAYRQQYARVRAQREAAERERAANEAAAKGIRERTEQILNQEKKGPEPHMTIMSNRFLYWSGLLFLTVMNFTIAVILLPLMLLMEGWVVYIIVGIIGLLFGFIFDFLIRDLEHLEKRHHLFAAGVIPMIAILDLFLIQLVAKNIASILRIQVVQNPLMLGSLYLLAFLMPFTYSYMVKREIE